MAAELLLEVRSLVKTFGALRATDDVSLDVLAGETHAVIGPNGAGKTTLIAQLSGDLRPDVGQIRFAGEDITRLSAPERARKGFARSFQITSIYHDFTVLDNVALAVQAHAGHSFRFWRSARAEPALRDPAREALRVPRFYKSSRLAPSTAPMRRRNPPRIFQRKGMKRSLSGFTPAP